MCLYMSLCVYAVDVVLASGTESLLDACDRRLSVCMSLSVCLYVCVSLYVSLYVSMYLYVSVQWTW